MRSFLFICFLVVSVGLQAKTVKAVKASRVPASASKVPISCNPPAGFSGLSATVTGDLKLKALPNGASKGTGVLKVVLMSGRSSKTIEEKFTGQYDDLTSVGFDRSFNGGAEADGESIAVFADFTRPEISYVEYHGEFYKTSCE